MSCEYVFNSCCLKLVKLSAIYTNEARLFQTAGAQHENRRAAVFVDEDCVDSRVGIVGGFRGWGVETPLPQFMSTDAHFE